MMAVKPAPGEVVTQTIQTTVSPAPPKNSKAPDLPSQSEFLDWIEYQPADVWRDRDIKITLRRGTETEKGPHCIKLELPPDQGGPFCLEWIRKTYGGGKYHLLAKVDGQLRYNLDFEIIGAPKDPEFEVTASQPDTSSEIGMMLNFLREQNKMVVDELRAARGGDNGAQMIRDSMRLQTDVLGQAVPAVASIISRAAGGVPVGDTNNPMQSMMVAWMTKMMDRMDRPEQNSLEQTLTLITKLKESGLVSNGGGRADMSTTLISMAPQVIGKITEGMQSMARMQELRIEELRLTGGRPQPQRQLSPQPNGPPPQPAVQVLPPQRQQAQPPQPPPAAPPQQTTGNPFLDFVQFGIVNILSDPGKPVDMAAHEALIFLDSSGAASMVDQMIAGGEDQVLELFRTQPILQNVPQNPRLTEFVKTFLRQAQESRQPEPGADAEQPKDSGVPEPEPAPAV